MQRLLFVLYASITMSSLIAAEPAAETPATVTPATVSARPVHLLEAIRLSASVAPVGVARLDTALARAGLSAQRMTLLPQLTATGGITRLTSALQPVDENPLPMGPGEIFDARLHLGQALLDLDSWYRTKAAGRRLAAADASAVLALENAATQAGLAYVSLASAEALLNVRRQDFSLADELAGQARARVAAGTVESLAETRAATRVASARSDVVAAEGLVQQYSIALARALHQDPAAPLTAADTLNESLAASSAPTAAHDAETVAFNGRPELHVSAETLAALDAERKAEKGAFWPRVNAFADGGKTGPQPNDTITTWQVGVQVVIPIVNKRFWDEDIARLRMEREHIQSQDLRDTIRADVHDALVSLTTAQARLIADLDAQRLAEQELNEARARFESGLAGNLEIIEAQLSHTKANERVLAAHDQAARARIQLARAVGVATTLH